MLILGSLSGLVGFDVTLELLL